MIEQTAAHPGVEAGDIPDDRSMKLLEYAVSLVAMVAAIALALAAH